MNPKVSVIIPTYNRANSITRTIKSVLDQTYQNFEIVVVNDSPNDETEKVVRNLNDNRIKYIRNEVRTNLPRARNQGVRESSEDSKYVAFLDDDDIWLPKFLEKTVKKLEQKKDLVMVFPQMELRSKNEEKIGETRCDPQVKFWEQIIGTGCIIRKEIFTKENFWYDERKLIDDLDFGVRVLKNHKWECIPEVLMVYHCYPLPQETSASSSLPTKEIEGFYEKHYLTYSRLGKKALGFFYFKVGREFLKTGEIKKGRKSLLKAFLIYPHPKHFLYYLMSLFFPESFQKIPLRILKQKIFKGRI